MKKIIFVFLFLSLALFLSVVIGILAITFIGIGDSWDYCYNNPLLKEGNPFRFLYPFDYELTYVYLEMPTLFYSIISLCCLIFIYFCYLLFWPIGTSVFYTEFITNNGIIKPSTPVSVQDKELLYSAGMIALEIGNPELEDLARDPEKLIQVIQDREKQVRQIKQDASVVEFPENVLSIDVFGHSSKRHFWVDREKNKTYFQLTTCPCAKCDNTALTFKPKNSFRYVVSEKYPIGRPSELYAEIEGIPEMNSEAISEFLNKEIALP